jgi:hypothetical protein
MTGGFVSGTTSRPLSSTPAMAVAGSSTQTIIGIFMAKGCLLSVASRNRKKAR